MYTHTYVYIYVHIYIHTHNTHMHNKYVWVCLDKFYINNLNCIQETVKVTKQIKALVYKKN